MASLSPQLCAMHVDELSEVVHKHSTILGHYLTAM